MFSESWTNFINCHLCT